MHKILSNQQYRQQRHWRLSDLFIVEFEQVKVGWLARKSLLKVNNRNYKLILRPCLKLTKTSSNRSNNGSPALTLTYHEKCSNEKRNMKQILYLKMFYEGYFGHKQTCSGVTFTLFWMPVIRQNFGKLSSTDFVKVLYFCILGSKNAAFLKILI